jgi:uncharacterized protein (DUF1810 family)
MHDDPFNLARFLSAQDPVYARVLEELQRGHKASHWMWFVFPQIRGLGASAMAERFAISGVAEAAAYAAHPVLGGRLRECVQLVDQLQGVTARQLFGTPDDLKFRSSMTLFGVAVPGENSFRQALTKYYGGQPDPRTLTILGRSWDPQPDAE